MKKCYFLLPVLICIVSACKKDKSSEYLTGMINGKEVSFGGSSTARIETGNGTTRLYISNYYTTNSSPLLALTLQTSNLLTEGTYTDTTPGVNISVALQDGDPVVYRTQIAWGASVEYRHFVVHLVSLDNNMVQGDFSGDVFQEADVNAAKKSITNGYFYLKLSQ